MKMRYCTFLILFLGGGGLVAAGPLLWNGTTRSTVWSSMSVVGGNTKIDVTSLTRGLLENEEVVRASLGEVVNDSFPSIGPSRPRNDITSTTEVQPPLSAGSDIPSTTAQELEPQFTTSAARAYKSEACLLKSCGEKAFPANGQSFSSGCTSDVTSGVASSRMSCSTSGSSGSVRSELRTYGVMETTGLSIQTTKIMTGKGGLTTEHSTAASEAASIAMSKARSTRHAERSSLHENGSFGPSTTATTTIKATTVGTTPSVTNLVASTEIDEARNNITAVKSTRAEGGEKKEQGDEDDEQGEFATDRAQRNGSAVVFVDWEMQIEANPTRKQDALTEAIGTAAEKPANPTSAAINTGRVRGGNNTSVEMVEGVDNSAVPRGDTVLDSPVSIAGNMTEKVVGVECGKMSTTIVALAEENQNNSINVHSLAPSTGNTTANMLNTEARPANPKEAVLAFVMVGNDTSIAISEPAAFENVTTVIADLMLNSTLLGMFDIGGRNTAEFKSGVLLSEMNVTVSKDLLLANAAMSLDTLALNKTYTVGHMNISLKNGTSPMLLVGGNETILDVLKDHMSFIPSNHSAAILSILAGNSTVMAMNDTAFTHPSSANYSTCVDGLPRNLMASISSLGNFTAFALDLDITANGGRNETTSSNLSAGNGMTVVGNLSVLLNDKKLNQSNTPYRLNETGLMGSMSGSMTGVTVVGNMSVPLFDAKLNQSDTLYSLNETALVMSRNHTLAHINITDVIGDIGLNETAVVALNSTLRGGLACANYTMLAEHVPRDKTAPGLNLTIFAGQFNHTVCLLGITGNDTYLNMVMYGNATKMQIGIAGNLTTSDDNLTIPVDHFLNASISTEGVGNLSSAGNIMVNMTGPRGMARNVTALEGNVTEVVTLLTATISAATGDSTGQAARIGLDDTAEATGISTTVLLNIDSGTSNNSTRTGNATMPLEDLSQNTMAFLEPPFTKATANTTAFGLTINSLAQVQSLFHKLGGSMNVSNDEIWDVLCTDEVLTEAAHRLTREKFDVIGTGCMKVWESRMNSAAEDVATNFSLGNFTQPDGTAPDYDGPSRTRASQVPTGSIMIASTSAMPSSTSTSGTCLTGQPLTTSSISTSSSFLTVTRVSSSMRPKITDCVDDFDFFKMSDANLAESDAVNWYANWTSVASSGVEADKFAAIGEVRYFGQVWLRDPDYDCGLELGGCTTRPSCNAVLKLYADDEELARKVYFVMKMHATINLVLKSYYDAIHLTHTNVAAVLKKIVQTSFQTPGFDDQRACNFLKTSWNNFYTLAMDLWMPVQNRAWEHPWFRGELQNPNNPTAVGKWWLQFKDPYGNKNAGFKWWKGKYETASRWWFADSLGKQSASLAMCEGLGMVTLDKAGAEENLRQALLHISAFQRKELSKHIQELNKGAFHGEGEMSALAGIVGMGIWANETSAALELLSDPYQLEERMTTQSREGILAQSYLSQRCYIKCTTHPHAHLLCEGYNDWEFGTKHTSVHGSPVDPKYRAQGPRSKMAEAEKAMRICPRKNKVCQVECWSQEKKGFTMPLHGISSLGSEPLNVNIQEKMHEIYEYYRTVGNVDPWADPESDPAQNPAGKLGGVSTPKFWLPVCDSDQGYTHIVDFGAQKHKKFGIDQFSRSQDRRSFPVSCGNYRSDETMEFMEAMGLTSWHTKGVSWTQNPFFKNYAALNAAVLIEAPLDNFLALCKVGLQYPQEDSADVHRGEMDMRRESSRFCEPIEEETKDMPWFVANLWFCKKSMAAKQLFNTQGRSGMIMGLHKVKNHERLCERWISTWQGESMTGMDETDGSQDKGRWIGPKLDPDAREVYRESLNRKGEQVHRKFRLKHWRKRDGNSEAEASATQSTKKMEEEEAAPPEAWRKCEGKEGIRFGWHFWKMLLWSGTRKEKKAAWRFLWTGHRDLRYGAPTMVAFEGNENSCLDIWMHKGENSPDGIHKRDGDEGEGEGERDAGGEVKGGMNVWRNVEQEREAAERSRVVVGVNIDEVRREEERYWKEIEEVLYGEEENE